MDLGASIFELIDMRSFSNLWYWIVLAVMWSSASHFVMGVPYDMVGRARRKGGRDFEDMTDLVRIKATRMTYVFDMSGVWIAMFMAFFLTMLGVLGFWNGVEFAQSVFLLVFPMTIVSLFRLRLAYRLLQDPPEGVALCHAITRHRFTTQVIGMISVFVTSLWGMYQNLQIGALG